MDFAPYNTSTCNNHKHITVANIQTRWNLSQKPAFSHKQFCVAMSHARNGCNIKFKKQTIQKQY